MTVWTEERIKEVGDLYRQGLTASQIAKRVKAPSRNAICGVIARYGLSGAKPIKPRKVKAAARPRYGGGSIRQRLKRADDVRITKETPIQAPPQPRGDRPTLMQLKTNDCRWPYGDPRHPDFHFCGDVKAGDGPYCVAHARESRGGTGSHPFKDHENALIRALWNNGEGVNVLANRLGRPAVVIGRQAVVTLKLPKAA